MEPRKQAIMAALDKFVAQRPGLEFGNYGDVKAYRSEMRSITRDRHDYNTLARAVERSDSITADTLLKASESAFSGRLGIIPVGRWFVDYADGSTYNAYDEADARDHWSRCAGRNERGDGTLREDVSYAVEYVTGQYFPTEYRKAAAAVLAAALWAHARENCMPPAAGYRIESWDHKVQHDVWTDHTSATTELEELGGSGYGLLFDVYRDGSAYLSAGAWLRTYFRKEFGRSIANRWFA